MKKVILSALFLLVIQVANAFTLHALRVEYEENPIGIDATSPRFSWQMRDTKRGARQTAYQLWVTNPAGKQVWNSGKVMSNTSLNIRYAGEKLHPTTRYQWTIAVWNEANEVQKASAYFETGLMTTSDSDAKWGGAQWIGASTADAYTFFSQYLPVFSMDVSLMLDQETHTQEAGFFYGANDIRLLNANKNILGVANKPNESYIKVVLNTRPLDQHDSARIEIYRVGYTRNDRASVPFATAKVPTSVINQANRYAPHSIQLLSMHGTTQVYVDDAAEKVIADLNLNPMGKGGDYISFPCVGDVGLYVEEGKRAHFGVANIRNYRSPNNVIATFANDTTIVASTPFTTPCEHGAPLLRTCFALNDKPIAHARLYISARGIYDCYVNGTLLSRDYFNPGCTQYNKTLFYQTYDITPLLTKGQNALGIMLNEGWWSGASTFAGENWNFYGDRQSVLAQAIITYADGTTTRVVSSPDTWQYTTDGPVRLGSFFQGEVYNALQEAAVQGWSTAAFDDHAWRNAVQIPLEGTISHAQPSGFFAWPTPDNYADFKLMAQVGKPVRHFTTLQSQRVDQPRPGVFVYDMGQNMAGVPRITFQGLAPGTKVYMRYAEVTYPNLPEYQANVGMVMMENQRGAMEQDIYIAKGGTETFSPRATYHGYRYVEITGIPAPLPTHQVEGWVLSTVDSIASGYKTNHELLNRFFKNVTWSTLANVLSIPTDCPQRNERMGWSGDLSVFSPAMSYLFNGANFFKRHLIALRDTQLDNGNFSAIAPVGGGFGGPLWASVGIIMPWQTYLQYADKEALAAHYPAMQRFIHLQTTKYIDAKQGFYNFTDGIGLGDWLGFEVNKNDNSLLFDCYLVHELDIMARAAKALGHANDAQRYAQMRDKRIQFINHHYINRATGRTEGSGLGEEKPNPFGGMDGPKRKGVAIDAQTSYALPLVFHIVSPDVRHRFVDAFLQTVRRESMGDDGKTYPSHALMTGFIGTAWLNQALSECGHSEEAYKMLLNTRFPSWLYPVIQGATTIWERLNSYTKENGFGGNNSMNSFNHYAFGSVTNWLMQHSLGIARDETTPGFQHFILQPTPDPTGTLTHAEGFYDSMYGRIESQWEQTTHETHYHFVVPANTSATLWLSTAGGKAIYLDGKQVDKTTKGVVLGSAIRDRQSLNLPAGSYDFVVK